MHTHMDALRERAAVAAQAGDFNTLINDQIDLLPQTNARLRAHAAGLLAVAKLGLLEVMALGRGYWQSVKSVATRR